jgi:molybdenum-dependent DNA-binding transcriptional regulator ModE
MKRLELEHGKPIKDIIIEALEQEGTISGAARRLKISYGTFYVWMLRAGVELKRTAVAS